MFQSFFARHKTFCKATVPEKPSDLLYIAVQNPWRKQQPEVAPERSVGADT